MALRSSNRFARNFGLALLAHGALAAALVGWARRNGADWTRTSPEKTSAVDWVDLALTNPPNAPAAEDTAVTPAPALSSESAEKNATTHTAPPRRPSRPKPATQTPPARKTPPAITAPPKPRIIEAAAPPKARSVEESTHPAPLPTPSVPQTGSPSGNATGDPDAISTYHERIQRFFERRWQQPTGLGEAAEKLPFCRISMKISRSGALSDVRLAESSGLPQLDASALAAVRGASEIEPLPSALQGDTYQLTIKFQLH